MLIIFRLYPNVGQKTAHLYWGEVMTVKELIEQLQKLPEPYKEGE